MPLQIDRVQVLSDDTGSPVRATNARRSHHEHVSEPSQLAPRSAVWTVSNEFLEIVVTAPSCLAHRMSYSRRTFLTGIGAIAAPMLIACRADGVTAAPVAPADSYVLDGTDVVVSVDRIPTLTANEQPVVLLAARIIVVRAAADRFRALSVECPHSGCAVSNVDGPKLICPCHGSEFDSTGRRLAGPAPSGLTELPTTFDVASRTLRVSRTA